MVWDHLIDPLKRTEWLDSHENRIEGRARGRIGPGTEYHCAHGDDNELSIFTVIDIKTLDYLTFVLALHDGLAVKYTDYVVPSGKGTRIIS